MASIVVAGDTSGTVTLTAPLVAGTTTLTLPTVNGTVLTNASSVARSQLPAGSVLQIINGNVTGNSTSSTTFVDSGLTASITPFFSTSRIFIIVSGICRPTNTRGGFALVRNSTTLFSLQEANGTNAQTPYAFNFLDSPATTSSTTYKLQIACSSGGGTFTIADAGAVPVGNINYITLMEIAG